MILSATLLACKPNLEGRPSLVDGDRVLAVRSIPAEAKGSAKVKYEALYVGTDGAPSRRRWPTRPACANFLGKGHATSQAVDA